MGRARAYSEDWPCIEAMIWHQSAPTHVRGTNENLTIFAGHYDSYHRSVAITVDVVELIHFNIFIRVLFSYYILNRVI